MTLDIHIPNIERTTQATTIIAEVESAINVVFVTAPQWSYTLGEDPPDISQLFAGNQSAPEPEPPPVVVESSTFSRYLTNTTPEGRTR